MAKSQDSQKDIKKKPTRTAAEKKALKQEKKKNKQNGYATRMNRIISILSVQSNLTVSLAKQSNKINCYTIIKIS